jgi:hypothetical protein
MRRYHEPGGKVTSPEWMPNRRRPSSPAPSGATIWLGSRWAPVRTLHDYFFNAAVHFNTTVTETGARSGLRVLIRKRIAVRGPERRSVQRRAQPEWRCPAAREICDPDIGNAHPWIDQRGRQARRVRREPEVRVVVRAPPGPQSEWNDRLRFRSEFETLRRSATCKRADRCIGAGRPRGHNHGRRR